MDFGDQLSIRLEIVAAFCAVSAVFFIGFLKSKRKANFPPGPTGWPIIGYIQVLMKSPHLKAMKLKEKYGDVFSVPVGSQTVVVLASAAASKEALAKPEFLEKPSFSAFSLLGYKSTFFTNDTAVWKEQRRFVVQAMKDLGFGKSKIEGHIQEEINHFIEFLKSFDGKNVEFQKFLTVSASNNINCLVFGKRYDYDDPERKQFEESLYKVMKFLMLTSYLIPFPWLQNFPLIIKWMDRNGGITAFKQSFEICKKKIQEHRENFDPQNIRDFIDSYLLELKNKKKSNEETTFTEDTLIANVLDLFAAGSETVRVSISWCIYVMAAYPEVQRKVQKEIRDVIGTHKTPEFSDQRQMPFTHAVIMETMRWKTLIPIDSLRYTNADTSVRGYDIPRGTTVISNFWGIHHDPEHWTEPDIFKPERFLAPDGKSVQKHPSHMPFSTGKRKCPGETMASMEIFLYFVSILQKFDVRFPKDVRPTFKAELVISYRPKPYTVHLIPK